MKNTFQAIFDPQQSLLWFMLDVAQAELMRYAKAAHPTPEDDLPNTLSSVDKGMKTAVNVDTQQTDGHFTHIVTISVNSKIVVNATCTIRDAGARFEPVDVLFSDGVVVGRVWLEREGDRFCVSDYRLYKFRGKSLVKVPQI